MKQSSVVYGIGGISIILTFLLLAYAMCVFNAANQSAKSSLSDTLTSGSLTIAGLVLVLLGIAMVLRDQSVTVLSHKVYRRTLLIFYVLVPMSLTSAYSSIVFKLSQQDAFFILSIAVLFLTGIFLMVGTTLLVARQM